MAGLRIIICEQPFYVYLEKIADMKRRLILHTYIKHFVLAFLSTILDRDKFVHVECSLLVWITTQLYLCNLENLIWLSFNKRLNRFLSIYFDGY
jgi:hypothetical protein